MTMFGGDFVRLSAWKRADAIAENIFLSIIRFLSAHTNFASKTLLPETFFNFVFDIKKNETQN